ncbi:MAG: DUF1761 domain-containing protein [Candidatus Buchananbacteria bacterium CG10_big_fil_rev_8_21_14_0_10_42_9]|uniref:DUF1761 domain-containing protein n=1 Tax=Candidatus Buchananbacteria bacterium CG10_big_fil_rev_8_21_14_0_10_42_9 TaxID=1974526 RepID=A0A2H0W0T6_9BACT|nr:MAG: DUF1761 domain-containing protein [Candidatus Buchananbacteria bacterium CG10_big_fil_rev_8_21_14_0_10_42_9]
MPNIQINYLAVIFAAVAYMIIGIIWYGPLFGKQWKALVGLSDDDMKKMKMTPLQSMAGGLVAALVMAFVLAHDAFVWSDFFGGGVGRGIFALQLAFWIWLGYVATTQAGSVLWEGRPWKLFFLNASNTLVSLMVMSLIITYLA